MRGTHTTRTHASDMWGIIPAYAGNTDSLTLVESMDWDHPRVCGEHTTMATWFMPLPGSSPRMRGTPNLRLASRMTARIIPAYAGNTPVVCPLFCASGDHPRVCGEHIPASCWKTDAIGIIPAYAGNTRSPQIHTILDGDHPRVCGEHLHCNFHRSQKLGSSPRMRGTPRRPVQGREGTGIIPAYAGNTSIGRSI